MYSVNRTEDCNKEIEELNAQHVKELLDLRQELVDTHQSALLSMKKEYEKDKQNTIQMCMDEINAKQDRMEEYLMQFQNIQNKTHMDEINK
jgi:hypothetical protein